MLDVCAVCDDLVDVDGYDPKQHGPRVLCGFDECLRSPDERFRCESCQERCGSVELAGFGDNDQVKRMACEKCIEREANRKAGKEVVGHPV